MISGVEWLVFVLLLTALLASALLTALWVETHRLEDVWTLSNLCEPLALRYRVLGRDHLARPDPFVLHDKPGAAAENSLIERSLVSTRSNGLPAVFEYVTYRDPMRVRRFGFPFLVLAARVPKDSPSFRLRPQRLFERFLYKEPFDAPRRHQPPPGWVIHLDESRDRRWEGPLPDLNGLAASGLWIQVSGDTLFAASPLRPWQRFRFTPEGIQSLVRKALPVLKSFDSPDAKALESFVLAGTCLPLPALESTPADRHPR